MTKFKDILGYSVGCLVNPIAWFLAILLCCSPVLIKKAYDKIAEGNIIISIIVLLPVLALFGWAIYLSIKKDELEKKIDDGDKLLQTKEKEYQDRVNSIDKELSASKKANNSLLRLVQSKTPFRDVAEMKSELETFIFEKDELYLRYKHRPAASAADKVKEIRNQYKTSLFESKQMLYKYEFLLSVFPELKDNFEDEESLIHIKDQYASLDDYNDNRDHVRDWLTEEEYRKLSVDERNQRALDRYRNRKKSNWEIGIEYELYIGYLLREGKKPFDGRWHVVQFGEKKGVEDLGRDIIADRIDFDGKRTVYVIQCKRWSEQRTVHENAICQLFGTTIEYKIKHRELLLYNFVPVFITTTDLSDMAKEFSKQLGVQVMKIPMGDYPMIKCNINNGEKIYHLPFDQQYHRTDISKEGEFYAMTVQEATSKGFRRAMRHFVG
jgi:hypothetical protein